MSSDVADAVISQSAGFGLQTGMIQSLQLLLVDQEPLPIHTV